MNKRDLIDAISGRLGDKKSATEAVNAVLETIQSAVAAGDKVAITGFGVFEKSERPARTARNPATGATIQVPKSSVPKFRAARTSRLLSTARSPRIHVLPDLKAADAGRGSRRAPADSCFIGDCEDRPSSWTPSPQAFYPLPASQGEYVPRPR